VATTLGVTARVLPMSDWPVRTRVLANGEWRGLQEFLIKGRGQGEVRDVEFRGRRSAPPTAEVLSAVAQARAIVIGPSNPVISIGPILGLAGMHEAIERSPAPVVAVSPIVGGQIVKGPSAEFMRWTGHPLTSDGVASGYGGLLDGLVADQATSKLPVLKTDVSMDTPAARRRVAEQTLDFALGLASTF
jgi:LPPG:FO 2-phospho-L-lactate transferase